MFFILSKIFAFAISPISWIILLLLFAILVKDPKRKKRLLIAGFICLFFFSNPMIFNEFMHAWEVPAVQVKDIDSCQLGIVLGGMISYDAQLDRVQFHSGVDRLLQAVELYRKKKIGKIFFLGGSGSVLHQENKEAVFAKRFLLYFDIPESDIMVESESRNTHENALFAKKILDEKKMRGKFILITSAFHMKRSIGCFTKAGIEVIPYSTDRYSGSRKYEFDHILIPNAGILLDWDILTHEVVGYLTYRLSGYL